MIARRPEADLDMNRIVGSHDVVLLTLDTLRFDVAADCFRRGEAPAFARWFPDGWEERHAPGSFTYATHQAFFAGFLPTPATPPWPNGQPGAAPAFHPSSASS